MPVQVVAFLDLVGELIAAAVWQDSDLGAAQAEIPAQAAAGRSVLAPGEAGGVGPIPSFPRDSHPLSRPRPTTPRRVTRRAPRTEAS